MDIGLLRNYYDGLACESGFESRCHMELPERSLVGARTNVGCRRQRHLAPSEQVGAD